MGVASKGIYVTPEEKETANNVDLVEYLIAIGEPIKSSGHEYYRHADHDSLVINERKNFFSWNSRGVSGNAVTYLMSVHNMSFQDAVKKINQDLGNHNLKQYEKKEPEYPTEFVYTIKERTKSDNVREYLVNERKIDPAIVDYLIEYDFIAEDVYQNVVFKWKDAECLIGANLQGTRIIPEEKRLRPEREYFKHVLPTTKEATYNGFNITKGYPENILYFESPIDLLSYLSLNKHQLRNSRLISMDGLKQQTILTTLKKAQTELKENKRELKSITLCVDNDFAGNEFIQKMGAYEYKNHNGNIVSLQIDIPDLPKGEIKWDWNNELKSRVDQTLKKKLDTSLEL